MMRNSKSEKLLKELRALNRTMNQATPDAIEVRKFRDMFMQLDQMLQAGERFPNSWITPKNRTILATETLSTIHDFDPPHEEQLRKRGLSWCGHPYVSSVDHCNSPSCGNYINNYGSPKNIENTHPKE